MNVDEEEESLSGRRSQIRTQLLGQGCAETTQSPRLVWLNQALILAEIEVNCEFRENSKVNFRNYWRKFSLKRYLFLFSLKSFNELHKSMQDEK